MQRRATKRKLASFAMYFVGRCRFFSPINACGRSWLPAPALIFPFVQGLIEAPAELPDSPPWRVF